MKALGAIGADAVPATAVLAGALKDAEKELRTSLVEALGAIGPGAKDAIPALVPFLKERDVSLVVKVLDALGSMRQEAKAAVPTIKELLQSDQKDVRATAAFAPPRPSISIASAPASVGGRRMNTAATPASISGTR